MTSSRPYLIRAIYDWIVDNDMTPHLLVNAEANDVEVPTEYIENGKIVLNIGPRATGSLDLGNDLISLNARFGGVPQDIFVPISAVLAIYARENGQGMIFNEDENHGDDTPPPSPPSKPSRSHLKVVK